MPLSLMQANAGTQGLRQPMRPPQALPPGVPQPGDAMGVPPESAGPMPTPVTGSPAGLASLAAGGYRGPTPTTSIGRGGIDFSNFPGAQNGVSPMQPPPQPQMPLPVQAAMAPGMSGQMLGARMMPPAGLPSFGGARGQTTGYGT